MTRLTKDDRRKSTHSSKAALALRIGLFNWAAWGAVIGAALAFDSVAFILMFFGIFFVLASLVGGCVGLVMALRAARAEGRRERRKAWAAVLLLVLLGPTIWLGFRIGYGSIEWTEEVKLASGEVVLIDRRNLNGPGDLMQRCAACVRHATFSGEYRGGRFEWSTDRAAMQGAGPLTLELVDGDPVLVFAVSGEKDCSLYGWPDPPFRVLRLERRRWLPDRWVEADFADIRTDARVNLLGSQYVPRPAEFGKGIVLTAAWKDRMQGYDAHNLTPHGARLSAVGEWLAWDPRSCRNRGRSPSDAWLSSKRAVIQSESDASVVTTADLVERRDEVVTLSADQVRDQRGVAGSISRTRGCSDLWVRVAALGDWVAGARQNAGGELAQSDVLISPVGSGEQGEFWVLPGPIGDYRQVICLPGTVLVVRSSEPDSFLLTRLGGPGTKPISQRVAIEVPGDLRGQTAHFWAATDDGREIHMAIYQDERSPEFGGLADRSFEYRGVRLSTLLRYRVPSGEEPSRETTVNRLRATGAGD